MAVWQYTCYLINKDMLLGKDLQKKYKEFLQADMLLLSLDKVKLNLNFITRTNDRWIKNSTIIHYGDYEDDDIYLYTNKNKVNNIKIRYSLRKNDIIFFNNIIKLANKLDCYLIDNDGSVIIPKQQDLAKKILNSRALKFVKNPKKFIDSFIRGNPKIE